MTDNRHADSARRALVSYVLRCLGLDLNPQFASDFPLEAWGFPEPAPPAKPVIQILTAPSNDQSGVEQPLAAMLSPADYVRRSGAGGDPLKLLEAWLDVDPAAHFEAWTHIIRLALSGVAGCLGQPGVSLYHEFKLMSAIVHAALVTPESAAGRFTLVSGDFPGIQNTIYTVSADGAAKAVRGRSFFLQLMADCVVHRLLAEAGNLPSTNALVVAGGNFLLLLPGGAEPLAQQVSTEISERMLQVFSGDMALVTGAVSVTLDDLLTERFSDAFHLVKSIEGQRKKQPYRFVAERDWALIFAPEPTGDQDACVSCQREPRTSMEIEQAAAQRSIEEKWKCPECEMFEDLAESLAKHLDKRAGRIQPYLVFQPGAPATRATYAAKLAQITGWSCYLQAGPGDGWFEYRLNPSWQDLEDEAFPVSRYLAVHSPLVLEEDVAWLREKYANGLPSDRPELPVADEHIRDFELIAGQRNRGFARLGVLRMDVDGLGGIFSRRLIPRTLPRLMAASDALSIFFEGYLPVLCQQFEHDYQRPEALYLLYAGGDDLFLVGEWDLLPDLALHIRDEFSAYTDSQITISAGIELVPHKQPFYQAAEMAKSALEEAKAYEQGDRRKDAISFLGHVHPWKDSEAWRLLVNEKRRLCGIVERAEADRQSSNVTRHVLTIYARWAQDIHRRGKDYIIFGPYMWLSTYQLSRMAEPYKKAYEKSHQETDRRMVEDLEAIQHNILQRQMIALYGPAARWAELERRAKERKER